MLIFLDIVKTYNQMLADELKPDIMSYRLAVFGHILQVSIILFYYLFSLIFILFIIYFIIYFSAL